MNCWKCQKPIGLDQMKIGFRAICQHCAYDLHTCTNCRYYSPGKPNDCEVPGTESVRDREAANFCEEFKVKIQTDQTDQTSGKQKFNSIFKDNH